MFNETICVKIRCFRDDHPAATIAGDAGDYGMTRPIEEDPELDPHTAELKQWLDAKPGAVAEPLGAARSKGPLVLLYKIMGKMFAILSIRGQAFVIVKCDPGRVDILREIYSGVGHRSHLDRRFWISVDLDSDVPAEEINRLVDGSYDLVRDGLTRKQKAELAALTS